MDNSTSVRNHRDKSVFEQLKAELARAFSAPESSYQPINAATVIERNQAELSR